MTMEEAASALRSAMAQAGGLIDAAAPDETTRAEGQAYVARVFATAIERAFNPTGNVVDGLYFSPQAIGGANSDYRMGQALIDPRGTYVLTGAVNDAARIGVGLYTPGPDLALRIDAYATLADADVRDGRFRFTIGPDETALRPLDSSILLMVRALHLHRTDRLATVSLTRLDAPIAVVKPRYPAEVSAAFGRASGTAMAIIRQFLRWTSIISAYPNAVTRLAPELDDIVQGDRDTFYFSGCFDLEDHEALVVELPDIVCDYWAIEALNYWVEPVAGPNINHATVHGNGAPVRIGIGPEDPGTGNWLDTGGRKKGLLLYRVVGGASRVMPDAKVITVRRA